MPDPGVPTVVAERGRAGSRPARDRLPFVLDGVVAVVLLLGLAPSTAPGAGPVWLPAVLALCSTAPLAVRRRWPVPVFAVTAAAAVASVAVGMGRGPFLAAAYAAYPVATDRPARRIIRGHGYLLCLAATPVLAGTPLLPAAVSWLDSAQFGLLVIGASWLVGRVVRERRQLAEQAAHRLAAQAVTAERLHIARELHDVVAHSISVIAVKAGVANHVLAARPEEAADALRVIESASREALTELRHLLGVLRADDEAGEPAELGPAPGLAGLPALVAQAERAGAKVELDRPDDAAAAGLPEGVELSAYRIVQEALTNVIKHAGPARVRVSVRLDPDAVRIEVIDGGRDGRSPPPVGPDGHGLIGMRERVAVYGGTLRAGLEPGGGFAVRAELPVGRTAALR